MKRSISLLLTLILLLSSFPLLSFAANDKIRELDIYEGLTARDDNLRSYLQRLHCASSSMPSDSIHIFAYENEVLKLEAITKFYSDEGSDVAKMTVRSVPFNGMDKNTNSSYAYAFVDRNKDYTLVMRISAYDFSDDAVITFNGSADKVSVAREDGTVIITVGPMKIAQKLCPCNCHYNPWQAKTPGEFFKGLWGMFQIKIWVLLKKPEHQRCECGDGHYTL